MVEFRIDELARAAGTSVRNVRVYQDRGLLAPPRRDGRIGWYSDRHLQRLQLIGRMLERGYTFATIRELLTAWTEGVGLGGVLGLREAIGGPWSTEQAETITVESLRERIGAGASDDFVAEAVRLGLLEPLGPDCYRVPSPRLLDAGADLLAAGIPVTAILAIALALRTHMDQVAELIFAVVSANLPSPPTDRDRVADIVSRLRPHALQAVEAVFAIAMKDRADGVLAELDARARAETASHSV